MNISFKETVRSSEAFFARIFGRVLAMWRFGSTERLEWYENMHRLRDAKITTETALETIAGVNRRFGRNSAPVYSAMLPIIRQGRSIDVAASPFVPQNELVLLAAGDRAASSAGYAAASQLLRSLREMRKVLTKQLAYPLALLAMAGFVIFIYTEQIIPVAEQISKGQTLPLHLSAFVDFTKFYRANIGVICLGMMTFIAVCILAAPKWCGGVRKICDKWFPPFILYRHYTSAVFLSALSALLKTEMSVDQALTVIYERGNRYLRSHLTPILLTYKKGDNEAAAFNTGLLDHNIIIRITAMSRAGSLKETLAVIGQDVIGYASRMITIAGISMAGIVMLLVTIFIAWALSFTYELSSVAVSASSLH